VRKGSDLSLIVGDPVSTDARGEQNRNALVVIARLHTPPVAVAKDLRFLTTLSVMQA